MIHTDTIYRASIFFDVNTGDSEHDVEVIERICDKALFEARMDNDHKVEVSTSEGGPCWDRQLYLKVKIVAKLCGLPNVLKHTQSDLRALSLSEA